MRWNKPHYGATRTITRFALFPIEAGNEVRWLENVTIRQERGYFEWFNVRFVDRKRRESEVEK